MENYLERIEDLVPMLLIFGMLVGMLAYLQHRLMAFGKKSGLFIRMTRPCEVRGNRFSSRSAAYRPNLWRMGSLRW